AGLQDAADLVAGVGVRQAEAERPQLGGEVVRRQPVGRRGGVAHPVAEAGPGVAVGAVGMAVHRLRSMRVLLRWRSMSSGVRWIGGGLLSGSRPRTPDAARSRSRWSFAFSRVAFRAMPAK